MMKKVNGMYPALLLAAICVVSCQHAFAECGIASTYSSGTRTASGERYRHMGISAAHWSLPFGTRVVVRNQRTGRSITVRINDRGPFVAGRIIDLSTGAKNALGMDGLARVCLESVSSGSGTGGFGKPGLRERLLKAINRKGPRARGTRTRIGKAHVRRSLRQYAGSRRGRKRYARAQNRKGYTGKPNRNGRRQFASRTGG